MDTGLDFKLDRQCDLITQILLEHSKGIHTAKRVRIYTVSSMPISKELVANPAIVVKEGGRPISRVETMIDV